MSKITNELLRDISLLEKNQLTDEISPEKRNQIIKNARREITDLKTAVSEKLFYDAPVAKAEAEAVFDSLNAVANGMDDPGAFSRMDNISEDSLFFPWKNFVLALRAFYRGKSDLMLQFLEKIEEESAPSALKSILRRTNDNSVILTPEEEEIFHGIVRKREQSDSDIEKINECRNAGYFEMLPTLMADFGEKNIHRGEYFTQSLTLRCFDILQEESPLSFSAIKKFFPVVGEFQAFRIAAVSSLKYYTEQALFYWIEATNALLDYAVAEDWDKVEALLGIIEEVWQQVNSEYQLTDDYRALLLDKVTELKLKIISLFGESCPFADRQLSSGISVEDSLEEIMKLFSATPLINRRDSSSVPVFTEANPNNNNYRNPAENQTNTHTEPDNPTIEHPVENNHFPEPAAGANKSKEKKDFKQLEFAF